MRNNDLKMQPELSDVYWENAVGGHCAVQHWFSLQNVIRTLPCTHSEYDKLLCIVKYWDQEQLVFFAFLSKEDQKALKITHTSFKFCRAVHLFDNPKSRQF